MRVQYNFAKNETWRDYIDVSNYTGMEMEHGGNTGDLYPMSKRSNLGHFDPNAVTQNTYKKLTKKINKELGGLKEAAI